MQCACTSAVDKVLAYCGAGSRQETTGQVTYIFFYRSEHKHAFDPDLLYTWTHVQSVVACKTGGRCVLGAITAQAESKQENVIADTELNPSSWSIKD